MNWHSEGHRPVGNHGWDKSMSIPRPSRTEPGTCQGLMSYEGTGSPQRFPESHRSTGKAAAGERNTPLRCLASSCFRWVDLHVSWCPTLEVGASVVISLLPMIQRPYCSCQRGRWRLAMRDVITSIAPCLFRDSLCLFLGCPFRLRFRGLSGRQLVRTASLFAER